MNNILNSNQIHIKNREVLWEWLDTIFRSSYLNNWEQNDDISEYREKQISTLF